MNKYMGVESTERVFFDDFGGLRIFHFFSQNFHKNSAFFRISGAVFQVFSTKNNKNDFCHKYFFKNALEIFYKSFKNLLKDFYPNT